MKRRRRRQTINLKGATEAEAMRLGLDKLKKKDTGSTQACNFLKVLLLLLYIICMNKYHKKGLGEAPSVYKILAPVWCVGGRVCIVKTGMSLIAPYRDTSLHSSL